MIWSELYKRPYHTLEHTSPRILKLVFSTSASLATIPRGQRGTCESSLDENVDIFGLKLRKVHWITACGCLPKGCQPAPRGSASASIRPLSRDFEKIKISSLQVLNACTEISADQRGTVENQMLSNQKESKLA